MKLSLLRKRPLFIDPSCVLYLDGNKSVPNSNELRDISGKNNHGTLVGVTWTKLPSGLWVSSLDGTDDLININAAVNDLATSTVGTWEGWVKQTVLGGGMFIAFGDTDAVTEIYLALAADGTVAAVLDKTGTRQWRVYTNAAALVANTWVHLAITHNATTPVLYVNGVAVAQTFEVSTDKTAWFSAVPGIDNGRIGCRNYNSAGNASFLTFTSAETRIYTRVFTAAELLSHYNQERSKFGV